MKRTLLLGEMFLLGIILVSVSGCVTPTASEHAEQLQSAADRKMTVGIVQKEIRKDMTQAEVAGILGSPNIVTRDKEGIETWIYDKIAREVSYSTGSRGIVSIIIGEKATGATSQTQRTLTIIIKFQEGVVSDFSYHSSTF